MSNNKIKGINAATVIFCIISVVGILYLILRWKLNKKLRKQVREMLPDFRAVIGLYNGLTDFRNYFSNFHAGVFLARAQPLYAKLPFGVESIGLEDNELEVITKLDRILRSLPGLRNAYNDEFVPREIEKYHAFFSGLEKYPLSLEQMEAVVGYSDPYYTTHSEA